MTKNIEPAPQQAEGEREAYEARFPGAKKWRDGDDYSQDECRAGWEAWLARAALSSPQPTDVPEGCTPADGGLDPKDAPGREQIWSCKIGGRCAGIPKGSDAPMRNAVRRAFIELTAYEPEFNFSGWAAELTEIERAIVENRSPLDEAPSEPVRRPLTEERIRELYREAWQTGLISSSECDRSDVSFARVIEKAHSIGAAP